jgi:hypothetical protein
MDIPMEKLDRAIVDWIAANTNDPVLQDQLQRATVIRRDYMLTGYFIYFGLPDSMSPLGSGTRPCCPDISAEALPYGAGTGLFTRNGKIHYLEIYARGGFFPEQLVEFRLVPPA